MDVDSIGFVFDESHDYKECLEVANFTLGSRLESLQLDGKEVYKKQDQYDS